MDFFEHQERARRNTLVLIFFFAVAVVLITIAVYLVLAYLFIVSRPPPTTGTNLQPGIMYLWDPFLFVWTIIGTLTIIATGTFYKMTALSAGGEAVARLFGAKLINFQTESLAERRLLNIVEEMSIASGMPVPRVYLLDEESINAFAAGFSTRDAIIGVTRGCMNLLSRDELQAVIAHEFSHILNGDMRLNLRLIGVLHGILVISLIGYWIFRISTQSSSTRVTGAVRKKGGGTLVILLAGLALMLIGYIGVFFARLIKCAVSRQREFLADAASVQFTRNPGGMVGALKKIGGVSLAGQISHPNAEEASHLFFADGVKHFFSLNLLATHPPLGERIHRIDPAFDGRFPAFNSNISPLTDDETFSMSMADGRIAADRQSSSRSISLDPNQASKLVGCPGAKHLDYVSRWLAALPPAIRTATRNPEVAGALIMAMLISRNNETRNHQLLILKNGSDQNFHENVLALLPAVENIPAEWFLPLAELALATIRTLPRANLKAYSGQLRQLIEADGNITLFEYTVQCMVTGQIKSWAQKKASSIFGESNFRHCLPAMLTILSTLAYYGRNDDAGASLAFTDALKRLPGTERAPILPRNQCNLQAVDKALSRLGTASMRIKKYFIDACSACIAFDGQITISEAELFRAVAACLDCPLPPFIPTDMPLAADDGSKQ